MTERVMVRPAQKQGLGGRLRKWMTGTTAATETTLVVTSRHRLWQRYGPDGVGAVERAVGELVDAMALRGLRSTLTYVDDSPLLTGYGVLPAETGQAESVSRTVRDLAARMAWTGERVGAVLILGDDGIVPFHRPENPAPEDGDEIYSDHIFGADPADPLRPSLAVGRLPDSGLELLVASIKNAAAAHARLARGAALPLTDTGFGYSASVWKRAARGVFATLGAPASLRLSPPLSHRELPEPGAAGPRYRYFNLHGLADSPHWFGQRDPAFPADYPLFPVALRPVDLDPAPGAVVFSEACFGAHIQGRRVPDSVALTYLSGGALAVVGATGVAYGGLDGPLVAADLLAQRFWQATLAGIPAGSALAQAKAALVDEAIGRQGYLDAEDEKAILNFVLYGDPNLPHAAGAEDVFSEAEDEAAGPRGGPQSAFIGRRPEAVVKLAHAPVAEPPADLVEEVRRVVAKRLPQFARPDVVVTASAAPRRVLAKSTEESVMGPKVLALHTSAATCCGRVCRETVRVTLDRSGRIRKLVVSH